MPEWPIDFVAYYSVYSHISEFSNSAAVLPSEFPTLGHVPRNTIATGAVTMSLWAAQLLKYVFKYTTA